MGVLSSPKSLDHLTPHFFVPRTYGRMVFTQGITYTLLLFCTYGRMVFTQVLCYTFLLAMQCIGKLHLGRIFTQTFVSPFSLFSSWVVRWVRDT